MGDKNQYIFLDHHKKGVEGAILEIGSKDHGSTENFRKMFPGHKYIGVDMESGPGVDFVLDLTAPPPQEILSPCSFGLVISCSVLEHVKKPWVMARHMSDLIKPDGILFLSVPWVWRYHPYPDDYFRFSPNGVKELFPEFRFDIMAYSTNIIGEIFDLTGPIDGVDNSMAFLKNIPGGKRKYLPYLMVNMIGRKTSV